MDLLARENEPSVALERSPEYGRWLGGASWLSGDAEVVILDELQVLSFDSGLISFDPFSFFHER